MDEQQTIDAEFRTTDDPGDGGNTTLPATRHECLTGLEVLGTTEAMKAALALRKERQNVILDYIADIFTEGADFGPADPRNPKKTLLKPGAEKICGAFNTRPTWRRDIEAWEMAGSVPGHICFICEIVDNATGRIVGEGRGASTLGEKSRDLNKCIKNAEKCAVVDAAIYTFNLSEYFTQEDTARGTRAHPAADLNTAKRLLMKDLSEARAGVESKLTDVQYIRKVCENDLHKPTAQTVGEVDHLRYVILEDRRYHYGTAEREPGKSEL